MGDTKRPSADAEGLEAAQRLAGLTLSLGEVPENLSLWGEPVWHPSCTQEKLINKILLCCTNFPTLGFSGDNCPK